ncbi:unnamed protein product [Prorocentrum cordatum]|uniref:Uncharacterized protein n=1 Tax=Prorocentrum cordatum TaxID=2364126 RepID=A0ABN9WD31_9DINO|nr:unnamed protein product [Polarella glacialis]
MPLRLPPPVLPRAVPGAPLPPAAGGVRAALAPAAPGVLVVPAPTAATPAAPAAAAAARPPALPPVAPPLGLAASGVGAAPPDTRMMVASCDMLGQHHTSFRGSALQLVDHRWPDARLTGLRTCLWACHPIWENGGRSLAGTRCSRRCSALRTPTWGRWSMTNAAESCEMASAVINWA